MVNEILSLVSGRSVMSEEATIKEALSHYTRSVEITRDVRFQANLRLIKRQTLSSYVVALLSLFVISISLLPNIYNLNQNQNQILLACSIILSVFIIFTSIIDGSQNYYHRGELLHRCARQTASVYHRLKLIDVTSNPAQAKLDMENCMEQYRQALDDCPVNHENVDFLLLQVRKPHMFNMVFKDGKIGIFEKIYLKMKCFFLAYGWLVPHTIAVLSIATIIYNMLK